MRSLVCLVLLCLIPGIVQISVFAQQQDGEKAQPQGSTQAVPVDSPETARIVYKSSEVDRKAVIVRKPEPAYTEEARKKGVGGKVRLQMVFGADGEVSDIKALTSLPHGLTENAVDAARLIKFKPAVKDGRKVSQHVTMEYNFWVIGKTFIGDEAGKVYYRSDCADFSRLRGNLIFFSDSKEAKMAGYKEAKTKCP